MKFWRVAAVTVGVLATASAQLVALTSAISTAWSSMQGILSAFKTTSKDTLLQTLTDQGYKTFMDKTTTQMALDIPDKYWTTFLTHMTTNLNIPQGQITAFQNYLLDVQFIGTDDWSAIDATFSTQGGGTCNYLMICANANPSNGTHSWIHANVMGAFTLMPNIFIISHEKSSFFSEKVTLQFIERPAGLQLKDFEPMFAFMKLIAFKQIGTMLGMDLPLK